MPAEQVAIWRWNHLNNTWEKEPAVVSTARVTGTVVAVPNACKLYWVACSPDAPAAEWQLADNDAVAGAIVYDHFDPDRHSEQLIFHPPMQFTKGIAVIKFDKMFSLVFGYI